MTTERPTDRQLLLSAALAGAVASSPIVAGLFGAVYGWNIYTVLSLILGGGVLWYTLVYVLSRS